MRRLLTTSIVLGLAWLIPAPAGASENATFECAAGPTQTCHFSIVRPPSGMQSFNVQGHQRTAIGGLAPGVDWYLLTVDHALPASLDACRHATYRCKVALVHRGTNQ